MESTSAIKALAALAQETRLAIFRLLVERGPGGLSAGRVGDALGLAPATLSFHLKELARAGLVTARPAGRFIYYCADYGVMNALIAYLTYNCCGTARAPESTAFPERAKVTDERCSSKPTIHPKRRFA